MNDGTEVVAHDTSCERAVRASRHHDAVTDCLAGVSARTEVDSNAHAFQHGQHRRAHVIGHHDLDAMVSHKPSHPGRGAGPRSRSRGARPNGPRSAPRSRPRRLPDRRAQVDQHGPSAGRPCPPSCRGRTPASGHLLLKVSRNPRLSPRSPRPWKPWLAQASGSSCSLRMASATSAASCSRSRW